MKRARPVLTTSATAGTGKLSVEDAIEIIRAAGVFDEVFYRERYAAADPLLNFVDPVSHYLLVGFERGFMPSSAFNVDAPGRHAKRSGRGAMNPLLRLALERSRAAPPGARSEREPAAPPVRRAMEPDFSRLLQARAGGAQPVLDVIMPVYAGYLETLHAIHAVLSSRNITPHELIVINDHSPDGRLVDKLQSLAGAGLISLTSNKRNLGFVRSVNKALALNPRRDAILLNSDTLVFGNWIDRLMAHVDCRVATVTPFSNNASLCSYPRNFESNALPSGFSARALDRSAARLNHGCSAEVPTGVGFCMYVSRAAWRKIGGFDARVFGKGYGEENDFCLRALDAGFRNLQALDVFVFHKGAVSFGESAGRAQQLNYERLLARHPGYRARLRAFAVADPARLARQRLDIARLLGKGGKDIVLYVMGTSGALAGAIVRRHERRLQHAVPVLVRPDPGGRSVSLEAARGDVDTPNLRGIALEGENALLGGLLRQAAGLSVEVHGLDGYAEGFLPQLKAMCRSLGVRCRILARSLAIASSRAG